jgi:ATP synthase F1 gamma subunit
MITLASLKQELEFNKSLGNIIEILKMTALSQFHSFQFKDCPNHEYLKSLTASLGMAGNKAPGHPYFLDRPSLPSAVVVVTSDEGFLGGLNTFLVNTGLEQRKAAGDEIMVLGERGARYVEDAKVPFASFPGISDDVRYPETEKLSKHILDSYKKRFGRIIVVYPRFISLTRQKVETFRLLPIAPEEAKPSRVLDELTLEPSVNRTIEMLTELWTKFKLFEVFWSSKQSEAAARIMHLEGSGQELEAINQKLGFSYFRRIHALSDKTIREVSAAKMILGKVITHRAA